MVNAYTEFLRVEQELSLYEYLRGGADDEKERRDRNEESGCQPAKRECRETLFSTSIYAHVLLDASEAAD